MSYFSQLKLVLECDGVTILACVTTSSVTGVALKEGIIYL